MTGTNNSCLENSGQGSRQQGDDGRPAADLLRLLRARFSDFMQVEDLDKNKDTLTPETMKKAGDFSQACAAATLRK